MKQKSFLFSLITIFLFMKCTSDTIMKPVVLTGHIENNEANEVKVYNNDTVFSTSIDSSGNFNIVFEINESGYYTYSGNERAPLFLAPGDSLTLSLNAGAFDETLEFSGKGSEVNNYLIETFLLHEIVFYDGDFKIFTQEKEAFIPKFDLIMKMFNQRFDQLISSNTNVDKKFIELEKMNLNYTMADFRYEYPIRYQSIKGTNIDLDDDYYSFFSTFDLNNANHLQLNSYRELLMDYVQYQAEKHIEQHESLNNSDFPETLAILNVITSSFTNSKIKNRILNDMMREQVNELKVNDEIMKKLSEKMDKEYFDEINEMYQELKPLSKGNPAPGFTLLDNKGRTIRLNDFQGKYLYVDVWSTTCAPCIREIPFLKKLKDEYKNKNIEIVGICLSGKDQWKEFMKKNNLQGIQLRAEKGWKSKFRNNYLKNHGVPCFILIDKEGIIIDARAARPSGNIRDILNKLEGLN